jgi:Pyruvate/2-oxoacid:ferredoxin oxidoreductase delta subunit
MDEVNVKDLASLSSNPVQTHPANLDVENARQSKKIPPERRRLRFRPHRDWPWYKNVATRLKEDSQFLRSAVQAAFALLCVWIGYEFHLFVKWGMSTGGAEFVQRPPGVEGFLPISALISLDYWIQTGIINEIHPSGMFIFAAILAIGLFLKKAFCSWMCPVGTLSESLWRAGEMLFGKNLRVPRWLDYPLRSLKYLLMLFFLLAVVKMDVQSLKAFIYSPYNKMADVKMYLFFANISSFALGTILILAALSVLIKNFWCRYLCPYGALLGFFSLLSPLKITRTKSSCIDCELCTRVCPANIRVHTAERVWSDECMNCLECVEVCPAKNTLEIKLSKRSRPLPSWVFGSLVVGTFLAVTGLAMLTGRWHNKISSEEYKKRFMEIESSLYQHNRGSVPEYGPHD